MGDVCCVCSQVGQGTANEVELLDLREELERKEETYEQEKGIKRDTAQGAIWTGVSGNLCDVVEVKCKSRRLIVVVLV